MVASCNGHILEQRGVESRAAADGVERVAAAAVRIGPAHRTTDAAFADVASAPTATSRASSGGWS